MVVKDLLLIPSTKSDAAELFAAIAASRKELLPFMPWAQTTLTLADEEEFLAYAEKKMATRELFIWTIKVAGVAVGQIDLHEIVWEEKAARLGYWLATSVQGHGYVHQALRQVLSIAFQQLGLSKLEIIADQKNIASQRVAQRAAFTLAEVVEEYLFSAGVFFPAEVFQLTKEDWEKKQQKKSS